MWTRILSYLGNIRVEKKWKKRGDLWKPLWIGQEKDFKDLTYLSLVNKSVNSYLNEWNGSKNEAAGMLCLNVEVFEGVPSFSFFNENHGFADNDGEKCSFLIDNLVPYFSVFKKLHNKASFSHAPLSLHPRYVLQYILSKKDLLESHSSDEFKILVQDFFQTVEERLQSRYPGLSRVLR